MIVRQLCSHGSSPLTRIIEGLQYKAFTVDNEEEHAVRQGIVTIRYVCKVLLFCCGCSKYLERCAGMAPYQS